MDRERGLLAIILSVYLVLGFGYSLLMPVWEAPDERAHYAYALKIARTGERPEISQNYEAYQPPLYYWLAGQVLRVVEWADPLGVRLVQPEVLPQADRSPRYDWNADNYVFLPGPLVLRWTGVLAGAMALLLVHAGVRRVSPGEPELALAVAALMGGIPQYLHVMASVNNDVLAVLAGALLFWLLAKACSGPQPPAWSAATFLLALALPLVTKLTALPLGLAAAAAVVWQARRRRSGQTFLAAGAASAGLLVSLFALQRAGALDTVLLELQYRLLTVRADLGAESAWSVAVRLGGSFWGRVGWLSVGLPDPVYAALTVLTGAGILAAACGLRREPDLARQRFLAFNWAALTLAGLMLLRNYLTTPQIQGRFLFPTLGPILFLALYGWQRLLPDRKTALVWAILLAMTGLNLYLWLAGVIPVYFQAFFDG